MTKKHAFKNAEDMKKYHLSEFNSEATPLTRPAMKSLQHVPCKFFRQGTCTSGKNCIFSHDLESAFEKTVCKYFQKGNCKFGSKCALEHILPDGRRVKTRALTSSMLAGPMNPTDQVASTMVNPRFSKEIADSELRMETPIEKKPEPVIESYNAMHMASTGENALPTVSVESTKKANAPPESNNLDQENISFVPSKTNDNQDQTSSPNAYNTSMNASILPSTKRVVSNPSMKPPLVEGSSSFSSGPGMLSSPPLTPENHQMFYLPMNSLSTGVRNLKLLPQDAFSFCLRSPSLDRSQSASILPRISSGTYAGTNNIGRFAKSPPPVSGHGSNGLKNLGNSGLLYSSSASFDNVHAFPSRRSVPNLMSTLGTSPSNFHAYNSKNTDKTHFSKLSASQSLFPSTSLYGSSVGTSQDELLSTDGADEFANEEDFIPNSLQELLTPAELERKMSHGDDFPSSSSTNRFISKASSGLSSNNATPFGSVNGTPTSSRFFAFFERNKEGNNTSTRVSPAAISKISQDSLNLNHTKAMHSNLSAISEAFEAKLNVNGKTREEDLALKTPFQANEKQLPYDSALDEETQFQMDEE
ncbi:zinc finger protein Cps3 [Schizosaccharomyces cryophilus OY26]|uniref:Zinc finger protein Cps3 n=1 Tax=Schizosaccharomyces cryophilus (strain OY26 / ATCC MYA-4695 / CBS 11777 / NBRC 106824 / NRRL Y48691) TaxID=653667 RepID=S9W434_SCHCR|nr:zinc finger protein Cps3 [Schizosaccharomyces cryophilus OY26]EPY52730.1 zinc finger protein Cps3 [Schizosaccharomyces cryophilus OY26]